MATGEGWEQSPCCLGPGSVLACTRGVYWEYGEANLGSSSIDSELPLTLHPHDSSASRATVGELDLV